MPDHARLVMAPYHQGQCEGGDKPCQHFARWRITGKGLCDAHARMRLFNEAKKERMVWAD